MSKKLFGLLLLGSMVLALSGCGGGGGGDNSPSDGGGQSPQTFSEVDVLDLNNGFIIDGRNDAGEDVTLEYCKGNYEYYSGSGHWYGHFSIKNDRVNMFDDTLTGGSYRIDTINNYFEVGEWYSIDFQNDEITVEQITEDLSC
jgi:hypothetical protein